MNACIAQTDPVDEQEPAGEGSDQELALPDYPDGDDGHGTPCTQGLSMGEGGEILEVPVECAPLQVHDGDPPPEEQGGYAESVLPP